LSDDQPITTLLHEFAAGSKSALNRLIPMLYPELQRLARGYMRKERTSHTLQPTALVHEAMPGWQSRSNPVLTTVRTSWV